MNKRSKDMSAKSNITLPVMLEYSQIVPMKVKYQATPIPAFSAPGIKENAAYTSFEVFEAFDDSYNDESLIISQLCKAVDNVQNGKDRNKEMEKWLYKYGFLTSKEGHETLEDFWREAEEFAKLWGYYKDILDRNVKGMKKLITVMTNQHNSGMILMLVPMANNDIEEINRLQNEYFSQEKWTNPLSMLDMYSYQDFSKNPTRAYQRTTFHYIVNRIIERIGHIQLEPVTMQLTLDDYNEQDIFRVNCIAHCDYLLQAMYFQFFRLLQGSQKHRICNGCGRIFEPERPNQKYCTKSCREAAKKQRQRKAARDKKAGNNGSA
mgnify:FL=1